jgi:thiosulfate/3-mercaptopyruvate sulfurtransferase
MLAGRTRQDRSVVAAAGARRGRVPLAPGAAELAARAEPGALGDLLDVEPGLTEQLVGERDPQPVSVVGQVDPRVVAERGLRGLAAPVAMWNARSVPLSSNHWWTGWSARAALSAVGPIAAIAAIAMGAAIATAAPATPGAGKPGTAAPEPGAGKPGAGSAGADPAVVPLVVTPAWLAAHLSDPDLVILHVGGGDGYRSRHIAGARQVGLGDISVSGRAAGGLTLELPPSEDLRRRLEALGISDRSRIVVYFESSLTAATRVVLTLDAAGLGGRTGLLDGGLASWLGAGYPVSDAVPPIRPGALAPLAMRPIIVDAATVRARLGKPGIAVVDARDPSFYDGSSVGGSQSGPHRTGHIAGAVNVPYDRVFDDQQQLRSTDELIRVFAQAGVQPGDTVIGYCHIGQQASAMLLAARRLGHPVALYDGAFEDWSRHPDYPVATGPARASDAKR